MSRPSLRGRLYLAAVVCVALALGGVWAFFQDWASLPENTEILGRSGYWLIVRRKDDFSDELSCQVLFADKSSLKKGDAVFAQRDDGRVALYWLPMRASELEGWRYRIDDKPASALRAATKIEQHLNSVRIPGWLFDQILKGDELRVKAEFESGVAKTLKLDLVAFKEAYKEYLRLISPLTSPHDWLTL